MKLRNKNLKILKSNHVYSEEMEHDACGVGLVASTEGLKSRLSLIHIPSPRDATTSRMPSSA